MRTFMCLLIAQVVRCMYLCVCCSAACRQECNTHRNQLRTVISNFMTPDVGIQLSHDLLDATYTDADWVVGVRKAFGSGHVSLDVLGRADNPKIDKRCRLACYLMDVLKDDVESATFLAQLVTQQVLALRSALWSQ